jgi:hypothetical protein
MEQSIHCGFTGYVLALVGQARHDLAGWQVFEFGTVKHPHSGIALELAKLVVRGDVLTQRTDAPIT